MKLCNLLVFMSAFYTRINSVRSFELLPVVLKFYEMREITSINAFLCNPSGERTTFRATKASYTQSLTSTKKLHPSHLHDLYNLFESQTYRIGILLDMNCKSSWDLLETASEHLLMNTSYVYALMYDDGGIETAVNNLESINVQFDSDITIFPARLYEIYDLFRTSDTRPVTAVKCGQWNDERQIIYSKPSRWDLDGVTIRATTVIKEFKWKEDGVQKFLDPHHHPEIDSLSRFALVAQNYLEYLCNFKTNLTTAPDWGYFRPETGKFDPVSMFGWLEEGKVDLGLTLSRQFSSRLSVSFWTPSTRLVKTSVLFRHPTASASYDGFARPFSLTTWLLTFLFVFISSLVLRAIRNRDVVDEPPNEPGYCFSLFSVLAILSLQGSYVDSLRIPIRVLSVILHFFGLMVYSYYGAEVVGFLLSPSPRTLTTVEKLVDSPLDLWVENVSFHINHFESVVGAKATKYYELAIKGPTRDKDKIMDREEALKKVKKGGVALYGCDTEMFQIIQSTFTGPEICSIYILDMLFMPVSVAIRKKSPYREIYYKALSRFLESGLRDYEDKKWHAHRPPCYGTEDTAPVELEATLIAQMIFVGGFILAITCFLVERAVAPGGNETKFPKLNNIPVS